MPDLDIWPGSITAEGRDVELFWTNPSSRDRALAIYYGAMFHNVLVISSARMRFLSNDPEPLILIQTTTLRRCLKNLIGQK